MTKETDGCSEPPVHFYNTRRSHTPEDSDHHLCRGENLKYHLVKWHAGRVANSFHASQRVTCLSLECWPPLPSELVIKEDKAP